LTQDTFARFLSKHSQIRDRSKVKAWLSTTLYRTFIGWKRKETRHPHVELTLVQGELPAVTPEAVDQLENDSLSEALLEIEERYRVPLALYYFENHSYTEISEMLEIPVGTVMSRLSRGKEVLRKLLSRKYAKENNQMDSFSQPKSRHSSL
jgi:RNA polymerase sigma-70 factor (ECF subfamily)